MRSKKVGSDLELSVMQSFSKTLKQMDPESANRVVNWLSSQEWESPAAKPAPTQTATTTLS